jgi:hypothetical protein
MDVCKASFLTFLTVPIFLAIVNIFLIFLIPGCVPVVPWGAGPQTSCKNIWMKLLHPRLAVQYTLTGKTKDKAKDKMSNFEHLVETVYGKWR